MPGDGAGAGEVLWSDTDMCFSESDNERFVEDRESKEYFKVEDLGSCCCPESMAFYVNRHERREGGDCVTELEGEGGGGGKAGSVPNVRDVVESRVEEGLGWTVLGNSDCEPGQVEPAAVIGVGEDNESGIVVVESQDPLAGRKSSLSIGSVADDSGFNSSLQCDHFIMT